MFWAVVTAEQIDRQKETKKVFSLYSEPQTAKYSVPRFYTKSVKLHFNKDLFFRDVSQCRLACSNHSLTFYLYGFFFFKLKNYHAGGTMVFR